jgi:hypothetical protein
VVAVEAAVVDAWAEVGEVDSHEGVLADVASCVVAFHRRTTMLTPQAQNEKPGLKTLRMRKAIRLAKRPVWLQGMAKAKVTQSRTVPE